MDNFRHGSKTAKIGPGSNEGNTLGQLVKGKLA
jgi:hypothetical protein